MIRRSLTMAAKCIYAQHLPLNTIVHKLNSGEILKGNIRINPKNSSLSFIGNPEKGQQDILIEGTNQNRALHGDLVAFELLPKESWKLNKNKVAQELVTGTNQDVVMGENEVRMKGKVFKVSNVGEEFLQKTAKVVGIIEKIHPRKSMGYAKGYNKNFALFSALDKRIPRMLIPLNEFPKGFAERPDDFSENLMIGLVQRWEVTGKFAVGTLLKSVGGQDDLVAAATQGILIENDLDDAPFPDDIDSEIPDFEITAEELARRKEFDFREKCVFTIDPATARDLDDACSVEILGNGLYEIGVHIADVSHFVYPGTTVDEIAQQRTTSVYMVQRVIPMLPRKLCENLCSLNPGVDRFSFSVVWIIDKEGNVQSRKFGKSLMRSCAKLHYEHAQDMIDDPDREFEEGYLPEIHNGFTAKEISAKVNVLHVLAKILRQKRKDSGSLSIQQCKIKFSLDRESGMPNGLGSYKSRESHKLIEEFMLKANESVAEKLVEHYPDNSIIRRHDGPKENVLEDTKKLFTQMGLEIDCSSPKAMQAALYKMQYGPNNPTPIGLVVSSLLAKTMSLAMYHSTGEFDDPSSYFHYGLSMPLYTHFTSPIRRYPDLIAHRQLQAILAGDKEGPMTFDEVSELAERSSYKKYASKLASDKSGELFLWLFLKEQLTMYEPAVVVNVGTESVDVLVLRYGVNVRVWKDYMGKGIEFQAKEKQWVHITWPQDSEFKKLSKRYSLLDNVVVAMTAGKQIFKINGSIPRPDSLANLNLPKLETAETEDS